MTPDLTASLAALTRLVEAAEARKAEPGVSDALRATLVDLEALAARLRASCEAPTPVAVGITRVWRSGGTRKGPATVMWRGDVAEFYPDGLDDVTIPTPPAWATGPTS